MTIQRQQPSDIPDIDVLEKFAKQASARVINRKEARDRIMKHLNTGSPSQAKPKTTGAKRSGTEKGSATK